MLSFNWEIIDNGSHKSIEWVAAWDGKILNDPLISPAEQEFYLNDEKKLLHCYGSPFCDTTEYNSMYKLYKELEKASPAELREKICKSFKSNTRRVFLKNDIPSISFNVIHYMLSDLFKMEDIKNFKPEAGKRIPADVINKYLTADAVEQIANDWMGLVNPDGLKEVSEVVVFNNLTVEICMQLSDDEAIAQSSGRLSPYRYRSALIGMLEKLWE